MTIVEFYIAPLRKVDPQTGRGLVLIEIRVIRPFPTPPSDAATSECFYTPDVQGFLHFRRKYNFTDAEWDASQQELASNPGYFRRTQKRYDKLRLEHQRSLEPHSHRSGEYDIHVWADKQTDIPDTNIPRRDFKLLEGIIYLSQTNPRMRDLVTAVFFGRTNITISELGAGLTFFSDRKVTEPQGQNIITDLRTLHYERNKRSRPPNREVVSLP